MLKYRKHEDNDGYCTYFIGGASGPVKIGRTNDLPRRLKELRVGSPIPLEVLGAVSLDALRCDGVDEDGEPDPATFEEHCHRQLARYRRHGEWFDRGAALDLWYYIRADHTDYIMIDEFRS